MVRNPVKITNYNSPIESTREQFLHESGTAGNHNKFVFNSFKTDRQRIMDLNSQNFNNTHKTSSNKSNSKQQSTDSDRENNKKVSEVMQPHMKFKHRTELERIHDAINDYSFGRADKNVIRKQLKSMNMYKLKRLIPKEEIIMYSHKKSLSKKYDVEKGKAQNDPSNFIKKRMEIIENLKEFIKKDESLLKAIGLDKKNSKKRFIDNSMSKYIMNDLHLKTHFKAASMYLVNKNQSTLDSSELGLKGERAGEKDNFRENRMMRSSSTKMIEIPSITRMTGTGTGCFSNNDNAYTSRSTLPDPNGMYRDKSHKSLQPDHNPLLSSLDFNPILEYSKKEKKVYDQEKLAYLKDISASNRLSDTYYKNNGPHVHFENEEEEMAFVNRKDEEEKIYIDNEAIPKSKVDIIAKKVLSKCNFLNKKSPYNNNILQVGNGKLAMTCGMSISQFANKFNIPK